MSTIFDISESGRRAYAQRVAQPYGDSSESSQGESLVESEAAILSDLPGSLLRQHAPALPEVSELQAVRHYTNLSRKNFSIDNQFYPLGSCTMKYNPRGAHKAANLAGFLGRHPLAPEAASQGHLACLYDLQEILRDVTFHMLPGSFHFLTGPSGAGKSTLLRLLFMSLRPSRGLIFVFGENVADLPRAGRAALRRRIGIVFQDFRLLDHLTTWENVALPLRVMGKKESDYAEDVTDLLRWVGLGERISGLEPRGDPTKDLMRKRPYAIQCQRLLTEFSLEDLLIGNR